MFPKPYQAEGNMKLKAKIVPIVLTTIFFITFNFCHGKGNPSFLVPITGPGEFKLFYEPAFTVGPEIPKEIRKEWSETNVRIRTAPGIVCLFSGVVSVYGVSICFPDGNANTELELRNILKFWNTNLESRTEREFFDFSANGKASIRIQLNRDLLEDINEDWLVLSGSKELDRMLGKENFPPENRVGVLSENSYQRPHSTNAFTGFSVLATTGKLRILFSSSGITNSANTLVVEIPGDVSILSEFFLEIQKRNLEMASLCKNDLPSFSETFGGTESSIGRFIEIHNPFPHPICFRDFVVETGSGAQSLAKGPQFLIPGETILKTESGSPLPGTDLVAFPWGDLKKQGTWVLRSKDTTRSFENRERTFLEGERYYSSTGEYYSLCFDFFHSSALENLCMDPGFVFLDSTEALDRKKYDRTVGSQENLDKNFPACDADKIQIEEVNLTGLNLNGNLDEKQKFIDLEYSGTKECHPNFLSVESDGKEIPIWTRTKTLRPGKIFTLGKRDYLKEEILLSLSDLKDFEYNNSILLKDRAAKRTKILSEAVNLVPVLIGSDASVHSLLYKEGIRLPHPKTVSDSLSAEIQTTHFMNPGKRTFVDDSFLSRLAEISEISWMGSYDGTVSVSGDRFVEIESAIATSQIVEILSGSKSYRFLTFLHPGWNVFSIGKSVCFPKTDVWIVPELSLGTTGKIRLLSVNEKFQSDWVSWDSQGRMGISSTSQKIRRSASRVKTNSGVHVWKNSALSDLSERRPTCVGTEASPGFENRNLPFFYKEISNDLYSILNPRISLNANTSSSNQYSIHLYNYLPNILLSANVSPFLNVWSEIRSGILSSLNIRKEALNYLIPIGAEDLISVPGSSGILISGIYPNPTVSANEWFFICNRGAEAVDVRSLEIRDSSASDKLVEYSFRFGANLPEGWNVYNTSSIGWIFADRFLNPNECAYVLSPNFKNESVPFASSEFRKIYTIDKTTTIGNGIGKNEGLDLFQDIRGVTTHIHSYGNQFSPFPFALDANTDELILLKENRSGDSVSDYEIKKRGNL
ncbi:hypothetical protein CH367_16980 [Leptospira barantonii]|uniref:Lamin tail domain-containing protein n=2 Tax=Leptospira barantonii TaxID=2023184 RepID=A0ABX4NH83_9LEPT|nr:hypothetical protein CH367_16980 [Leptospira barantonii]